METIFALLFLSFLTLISSTPTPSPLLPKEALPTKSGYLPISTNSSSSLFFTFYEAKHPTSTISHTPLLVWLQGGPGCSSMIENFFELGPWLLHENQRLQANPASWNRIFGLLFIDNPIGAGFSFASSTDEIPRDQHTVAKHLYNAIRSFLALEPSFLSRPLYITGESYGGKFVPSIGYYILKKNSVLPRFSRINLRGVAIGNGLTHPVAQVTTNGATAYFSGLINERQRAKLEELQHVAVQLTKEKKWSEATNARNLLLQWLRNETGLATLYDYRKKRPYEYEGLVPFLRNEEVVKALRAKKGVVWEACRGVVEVALHADVMKSVKFMVEALVKKVKVLLYQGMFDLRDGPVMTEAWVRELEWDKLESFLKARRRPWEVNEELAGYVQRWGRLSHVVVSVAGHLVPADQGLNSQAMIEDWILEKDLFVDDNES